MPLPTPAHHVLATAPRDYLTRLRRGMLLIEVAGIITALLIVLAPVMPAPTSTASVAPYMTFGIGIGLIALLLAGTWQATASDPRFRTADTFHRARRSVRPAALWVGCFLLVQFVFSLSQTAVGRPLTPALNWLPDWLLYVLVPPLLVANVLALIVLWIYGPMYLRELARRGNDDALAAAAWRRIWLFPLSFIAVCLAAGLLEILPAPFDSILPTMLGAAFIMWIWVWPFERFRRLVEPRTIG